jgi:hypothetical protein
MMGFAMLRGGLGGPLLLDPEGVTYVRTRRSSRASWDAVTGIRAVGRDKFVVDGLGEVRTERLSVDPLVVFWALRYYRRSPEDRAELADGRALERVRREELTDEDAPASGS